MAQETNRTATISNEAVRKRFNNHNAGKIISEYIWNGIDANAKSISIKLFYNDSELKTVYKIDILESYNYCCLLII